METILKSDLDKGVKLGEIEVFTAEQIKSYVEQSNDAIEKSIGDKDALRSEVATEVKSFRPIKVWDDTTLEKSIQFIRPAQIKWDEPTGDDISKSRSGTYMNTPENRKKGIVGNKYGHEKKEGEPDIKDMMKRGLHAADDEKEEKEENPDVQADDILVDTEGREWEVRTVNEKGCEVRDVDDHDKTGFFTWSNIEEFEIGKKD